MLTINDQKEIIIDRLAMAFNSANKMAKFSRSLKLYENAAKYYYKASAYKKAIHLIKILADEPNNLTFYSFP